MLTKIDNLKSDIIGFKASGVVTKEDYTTILMPAIESALTQHDRVNVLYLIDKDFDHYAWEAMIQDAKLGVVHPFAWQKIVLVTDLEWINNAAKFMGAITPFKLKVYPTAKYDEAIKWLEEKEYHLEIKLDEKHRILTLDIHGSLTEDDFTKVSKHIDPYLAQGHTLRGLMIKTKNFPGWDSFWAMKKHISFVKEHHTKIDKLALVTDSTLIDIMENVAGMLVHPDIKEFEYNQTNDAYAWLKG